MGWVITKDNIEPNEPDNRVGQRFVQQSVIYHTQRLLGLPIEDLPSEGGKIAFRLRDEDGEVSYEGVMDDDPECMNQVDASDFGEVDTGAFICEVWRDGKWVMEVG